MKKFSYVIICSLALILSSLIISNGMTRINHQSRTVSVRGLAEREVDADMAVWRLTFSLGGNDLPYLQKEILSKTSVIRKYLEDHSLDESDYAILSPEITDTTVNIYMDSNRRGFKYVAKQTFLIRSTKIDKVKSAAGDTLDLIGKEISVLSEYENRVNYEFNGLNAIKPEMIAQATENARLAAEQFARDSHSKVGKIVTATQGLFSIEDAAVGLEEKKKVRIVTTVVYSLAD